MQPGDTITPGASAPTPSPQNSEPPRTDGQSTDGQPQVSQGQSAVSQPNALDTTANQPQYSPQLYTQPNPYQTTARPSAPGPSPQVTHVSADGTVSWTASEYMSHQKNGSWYMLLVVAAVGASLLVLLVTGDFISAFMIVLVAGAFGVLAARQPRTLQYSLDEGGIHIAHKYYPYSDFKSFSIIDEGAISSIYLIPLKRFMPALSVYYAPEDEEEISNMLSQYLPYEERARDRVDKLMHKIRF